MKSIDFTKLIEPFPADAISWRAQIISKDGNSALALAYVDARDVMKRLDEVCGVDGWQCRYPHAANKTICEIGIKSGDEWVWKADGAGDTDIEAEKGAISDAFKRAAVKWGIGRHLYDMPATWCACKCDKRGDKFYFKEWIGDPSGKIPQPEPKPAKSVFSNASLRKTYVEYCISAYEQAETASALNALIENDKGKFKEMRDGGNEHDLLAVDELQKRYRIRLGELKQAEINAASFNQGFNQVGATNAG